MKQTGRNNKQICSDEIFYDIAHILNIHLLYFFQIKNKMFKNHLSKRILSNLNLISYSLCSDLTIGLKTQCAIYVMD